MPSLELIGGPNADTGAWYPVASPETLIGRDGHCQVQLNHNQVSRHHARIICSDNGFQFRHESITNSTYVNHRKVTGPCLLREGDRIQIAPFTLVFHLADVPTEKTRPEFASLAEQGHHATPDSRTVVLRERVAGLQELSLPDRLRAMTEITRSLTSQLNVDSVLPHVLNVLFGAFQELINGQILLRNEQGHLMPRAVREGRDDDSAKFPMAPIENAVAATVVQTGEMAIQDSQVSDSVLEETHRLTVALPVVGPSRQTLGVIYLEFNCPRSALTNDDLEMLSIVAHTAGLAVELAQSHQRILVADRYEQSMQYAREVQLGMLPASAPAVPGYQLVASYQPAQQVGGDFYCYLPLSGGRLMIAMGDIVGKGVPAALQMSHFISEIRHVFANAGSLKEAMRLLNQVVGTQVHKYLTLAVCVLDPRNHRIVVVNAGHPAPLCLRRADRSVEQFQPDRYGLPLGVDNTNDFHPQMFELCPGDLLLLYTDGLTDTINIRNDVYGSRRLLPDLRDCHRLSAQQSLDQLLGKVNDFRGAAEPSDDTCLLFLQRLQ